MKNCSLLFLLFLCFGITSQGQERVIKGRVANIVNNDTLGISAVSICIIPNLDSSQLGKPCNGRTFTIRGGYFYISCDTTINKYLEISRKDYTNQFLKIAELSGSGNLIILQEDTNIAKEVIISTPYKPAIYLYPKKVTNISVTHKFKGTIGTTYPAYNDGWHVTAQPNGALYNLADKRNYEYLFWDGTCTFPAEHAAFKDGFVVHKKDLPDFLLEKLTLIGLNNKETNDFIVYWLPMLNQNEVNFIHFRINDNIDNASILTVTPKPDSWIRLFMEYKEVDSNYKIPQQPLKSYPRKGFTLVEWGGSKIGPIEKVL